ncbi:DUF4010 domain-containing protein [Methylocapsa polymorpha]|uniref:DUF4010 domain-containing protein n=1 Tax=Methylocapsa polymorpha TaxID=3080828 RepID=A0ABZ0HMR5_9HYPH|nr:DUF4010 domain-containing protein [Methylocapsa sp. RX1]
MFAFDPVILSLAVAIGIGLLIGTERERRKGERPAPSAAGIRTFALASLTGALSTIIGGEILFAVTIGGVFALTAFAYWRGFRDDPGLTTEVALVVTVLLGGLSMTQPGLAAGVAVAVAIVLAARTALHRFVRSVLNEDEVRDALIFAAATLIVLPLLPDQQMGPFGALNPHAIWIIVILVMAIGAFGHIAVRILGPRFGLPIAGLASGFISSIATIGAMGARATEAPGLLWPAAAGAILSTVATVIQMALLLAATNIATLEALLIPLACAGAAAILYAFIFAIRALRGDSGTVNERGQAFSLWTALVFAGMLSAILLASRALNDWFGVKGVIAAAAVAGFADTHSAAISIAALVGSGKIAVADAAFPILIALSTNTVTKLAASLLGGGWAFALRVVPGLVLVVLAAWAGWWLR